MNSFIEGVTTVVGTFVFAKENKLRVASTTDITERVGGGSVRLVPKTKVADSTVASPFLCALFSLCSLHEASLLSTPHAPMDCLIDLCAMPICRLTAVKVADNDGAYRGLCFRAVLHDAR